MHNPSTQGIIIFIAGITFLLLLFICFIVIIVYKYRQKQNVYFKDIETLKTSHENELLQSQLEIQEQTFQNISREIHDNIGQKLTLAKLLLNTLNYVNDTGTRQQVGDSINMISEAINDLTDISRSMSSEIILNNGLIKALEFETTQLEKSGAYKISLLTTGEPVFMNANTELILFRIVQEAINNIIKHAGASAINISLHYAADMLTMQVNDNGKGFNLAENTAGTGLQNIKKRAIMLKGNLNISGAANIGTTLKIEIPLDENSTSL